MLPATTLITVTVAGEAKGLITGSDLLAAVVQQCGDVPLTVVASSIDAGNVLYNVATFQWLHYAYSASVTVSIPSGTYDTADQVGAAVGSVFEDVAGSTPTSVQASPVGQAPPIGAPAGSGSLTGLAGMIQSDVTWLLVLLAALVALVVVAIGWGPNAPVKVFA